MIKIPVPYLCPVKDVEVHCVFGVLNKDDLIKINGSASVIEKAEIEAEKRQTRKSKFVEPTALAEIVAKQDANAEKSEDESGSEDEEKKELEEVKEEPEEETKIEEPKNQLK